MSFLREFVYEPDPNGLHKPPQNIESVYNDMHLLWRDVERFLRPEEVRKLLMRQYLSDQSDESVFDLVETMERRRFNDLDPLTGYMRKSEIGIATGMAHLYAKMTERPVGIIEVDFSNMGGTNVFFQELIAQSKGITPDQVKTRDAEDLTDQAAKIVAQIILAELKKYTSDEAVVLPVRAGGDELRITFTGVDPRDFKAVKNRIQNRIELTMARCGLLDHPHLKAPEDETRRGFGAAISVMDMRKINAATYAEQADAKIEVEKKILGHVRVGKLPPSPYILNMAFSTVAQRDKDETIQDVLEREVNNRHRMYRDQMTRYGTGMDGTKTASQVLANIRKQMDLVIWELGSHKKQNMVFESVWDEGAHNDNHKFYASAEEEKELKMVRVLNELDIATDSYEIGFIVHALKGLTPYDPATGVSMARDLPRTLEIYMTDVKTHRAMLCAQYHDELPKGPIREALRQANKTFEDLEKLGPLMMALSVQNLAGLNKLLGHDNANKVLRFVTQDIIKKTIAAHHLMEDDYTIVHYGGGEFMMVLKPVIDIGNGFVKIPSQGLLDSIRTSIERQVEDMNAMPMDLFATRLEMDIDNPQALAEQKIERVCDIPDGKGRKWVDGVHVSAVTRDMTGTEFIRGVNRTGSYIQELRNDLQVEVESYRAAMKQAHDARQASFDIEEAPKPKAQKAKRKP